MGSFKSGGFLSNTTGVIRGYKFTDSAFEKKPGGSDFNSLFVALSVRPDGAEEDIVQHLWAGGADDFEISDDGLELTPVEEGNKLGSNTPFAKFMGSLATAGHDADPDTDPIHFRPLVGARVTFVQVPDESMAGKKRKDKKTGKEYPYTRTEVSAFHGVEAVETGKKTAKGAKAAAKPATKGKGAAKTADASEPATEALLRYLDAAGGELPKSKLRMKVLTDKTFAGQAELKESVALWLNKDENLEGVEGVEFDAKAGTVSIAA